MLFTKKNVSKGDIATSLIVETQLVLLGTLLVTLISVPFLIRTFFSSLTLTEYIPTVTILLFTSITFAYIYSHKIKHILRFKILQKLIFTPFTPRENAILLFLSILCYSFFGLGYFFIIASIVQIHPQMIWELTGFFAFSLLVGYVSLLTPTGLGIREGILVLGLKGIAPVALVGFASIFTRFILIISEITYLALSFMWYKATHPKVRSIEAWFSKYKTEVVLGSLVMVYSVYFSLASMFRYDNFYTGRFDLGNMAQTVWNTTQGRIFELTNPNGTEIVSRLAFHADFILILLAPFYFIWSDPKVLLVIQSVVVGLGAVFVYALSRDVLKGKWLPLLLAAVYLLNPSLQRANLYDFHAVVLSSTFLLGAFYFLQKKRLLLFLFMLFLAAITKEQVWLIVAFFGVYIAWFKKQLLLGAVLFVVGVSLCWYLISFAIPQSAGSQHFALSYYSEFGEKPTDIVKNIVFSPHKTLPVLFEKDRIEYMQQVGGPVGFLVLFAPFYLLFASGDLGINLLSNNPQLHQIYYQYTATITPFLFIAVIYGIKRLTLFFPQLPRIAIATYLVSMTIYTAYLYGPLPGAKEPNLAMFTDPQPNAREIDTYIARLPKEYSVSAPNNLASHFSHREEIFVMPLGVNEADILAFLVDPKNPNADTKQHDLLIRTQANSNYLMFYEKDGFFIFKKMQKSATINR